ncbi:S41 family peptidase [Streptomyces subrutilus]|uniref:PDZ domain-containing protein n=1 Tax=Streptomyces subrutilus TaxID=36818 RepID=A0A5P2UM18_9ACTN|nr:S41 family peptidase [Streptomyces subrutilus]QEU80376.1 PDZ domain-containing protein [Streptomyces subrutilus]WSJ30332.1 S41 family peptidase [Streptomyces subrutilus]GGZ76094.1 peptidase S41 [Streptomyces subrutilus]
MQGLPAFCLRPRDTRRGAVLTLAFLAAVTTAASTGCWDREEAAEPAAPVARGGGPGPAAARASGTADREAVARAVAEAVAEGKSGKKAAQEVVSRSGDRWGTVYDRGEYAAFAEGLDGRWTGVGLWARREPDGAIDVDRVEPGGPAARAGLRAGDRLLSVDGHGVTGLAVPDVVSLLRGASGTPVVLGLSRAGADLTETVRREELRTEPVTAVRRPDGTTVVKVASFTRGSGELVRAAVRAAPPGAGILLDLRGNPGGLVAEAVAAASAFLDGGLVATYDVRGEQRALYAAPGGDTARPLVALVDGGTMSAAELLTGALQDRGRAVAVGSRTFGKGSVQMPTALPDGSVAELTVGTYRTPAGRSLDGTGITPDLAAGDGAEERAAAVMGGLGVGP